MSMLLHALQTIIFMVATGAQAESIPHRGRMTQPDHVAMEVEADGMDDQHAEEDMDDQDAAEKSQKAPARIIRSSDSVRKQPVDEALGEPVLPPGSACTNRKGTCHSTCAKTVSGHTYKREWCYTTPERKAKTKKWCFCVAGGGDDDMPEQVVASKSRGSAIPVEEVASGEQPPEPPQAFGGKNDDLVNQVKAMSGKLEGLQSIVDDRLGKLEVRMKQMSDAAAAGKTVAKDDKDVDLDGMNSTNETNSTNSSNETDTDNKVKKGSACILFLFFFFCCCVPFFSALFAANTAKAPTPPPPAEEAPPEQQESVTNPGDEQADPAAPPSEEISTSQRQSVVGS